MRAGRDPAVETARPAAIADAAHAKGDDRARSGGGTIIQFPKAAMAALRDTRGASDSLVDDPRDDDDLDPSERALGEALAETSVPPRAPAMADDSGRLAAIPPHDPVPSDLAVPAHSNAPEPRSAKHGAKSAADATRRDRHVKAPVVIEDDHDEDTHAFFESAEVSFNVRHKHDTFEDLKPEPPTADHHGNRRNMIVTGVLAASVLFAIGGFEIDRKYFSVDESPALPAVTAALAMPMVPGAAPLAAPAPTAAVAAPTPEPAAAPTPVVAPAPAAAPVVAAAAPATAPVAVVAPAPVAPVAPVVAAPSPVAPAAGGDVATLLQAAHRAQSHGTAVAIGAWQAYVAAGGNDAGQLAGFAYWLANSKADMGHASEWAGRATALDGNSQLGWYIVGVTRSESGPQRDRTAAREALRHCAALPGRYASECRSLL